MRVIPHWQKEDRNLRGPGYMNYIVREERKRDAWKHSKAFLLDGSRLKESSLTRVFCFKCWGRRKLIDGSHGEPYARCGSCRTPVGISPGMAQEAVRMIDEKENERCQENAM
jgi:hypothetical protein